MDTFVSQQSSDTYTERERERAHINCKTDRKSRNGDETTEDFALFLLSSITRTHNTLDRTQGN